nr:hypothetical protein [Bacteroidota bacterium]
MKKENVLEVVSELPKEFKLDQLIEKLIFIDKVEQGIAQVKQKKTISHKKVKDIIKKW